MAGTALNAEGLNGCLKPRTVQPVVNRSPPLPCGAAAIARPLAAASPRRCRCSRRRRCRAPTQPSHAVGLPYDGRLVGGVPFPPEGEAFVTWDPVLKRRPNRVWRRYATDADGRAHAARCSPSSAPRIPTRRASRVGDLSRPQRRRVRPALRRRSATRRTRTASTSTSTTRGSTGSSRPRDRPSRSTSASPRTSSTCSCARARRTSSSARA